MSDQDDKTGGDTVVADDASGNAGDDKTQYDSITLAGDESSHGDGTSKNGGPAWLHRRIAKLNNKIDQATTQASEEAARAELVREENKLLRMQVEALQRGDGVSDLGDDDQPRGGMTQADVDRRAREIVNEELGNRETSMNAETSAAETSKKLEAHYERAGELNVPDYEATEDKAIEVLGQDISRFIMASSKKSQLLMYYLGKNEGKAAELAYRIRSNPGSGAVEIGELAAGISLQKADTQTGDDLPEPDADIGGEGSGVSASEARIDAMRKQVAAGKRPMKDLMDLKRSLAQAS